MRYTLTDKTIAIILSIIILIGTASAFTQSSFDDGSFEFSPEYDDTVSSSTQADDGSDAGNEAGGTSDTAENPETEQTEQSETEDEDVYDGSAEDGGAEDGSAEDGSAEDGSAEDGSAEDGSNDSGNSGIGDDLKQENSDDNENDVGEDDDYLDSEELFAEISGFQGFTPFNNGTYRVGYYVSEPNNVSGIITVSGITASDQTGIDPMFMDPVTGAFPEYRWFEVEEGREVTFTATSLAGTVLSWSPSGIWSSGGQPGDETAVLHVTSDVTIVVVFEQALSLLNFGINMDNATANIQAGVPIIPGVTLIAGGNWVEVYADPPPLDVFPFWILTHADNARQVLPTTNLSFSFFQMPKSDTVIWREFMPGKQVSFTAYNDTTLIPNPPIPRYAWEGGTNTALSSNPGPVPQGVDVLFTAPAPAGDYAYEWIVNGSTVSTVFDNEPTYTIYDIDDDVDVVVNLIPLYEVTWDVDRDGDVTVGGVYSGTPFSVDSGDSVLKGTVLTFTATAPAPVSGVPFHVYEYRWGGTGTGLTSTNQLYNQLGAGTFTHTVVSNTNVDLTLVRGHYLTFSIRPSSPYPGTVSATINNVPVSSGSFLREGSQIEFVTVPSQPTLANTWIVNNVTRLDGDYDTFSLTLHEDQSDINPLADPIDVEVTYKKGYQVFYETAGDNAGEGTITAIGVHDGTVIDPFANARVAEEDTHMTFTAEVNAPSAPDYLVYRIEKWEVRFDGVLQTPSPGTYTITGNELSLTIVDKPVEVLVFFEEVTLTLDPMVLTIRGHGSEFIFHGAPSAVNPPSGNIITVGGNSTGNLDFDYDRALPSGLTVLETGTETNKTITVNSNAPLSYLNNTTTPHIVYVEREGVVRQLLIHIEMPHLIIESVNSVPVVTEPASVVIDNDVIDNGFIITLRTNAMDTATISVSVAEAELDIPLLLGLPGGLGYEILSAETITSGANAGDIRIRIEIKGDRSLVDAVKNDSETVYVEHISGAAAALRLDFDITPPPSITSIEYDPVATTTANGGVPFDFESVRVHGTPPGEYGTMPGPLNVVFRVEGTYLSGSKSPAENMQAVINSLQLDTATLPAWVSAGVVTVNVTSNTTATVTVSLTVTANGTSPFAELTDFNIASRTGTVTVITTLDNPPSQDPADLEGLTVYQYGRISLVPSNEANINNSNETEDLTATGSGTITFGQVTHNGTPIASLPSRLTVTAIGDDIHIVGLRPSGGEADVEGVYTIEVIRDGIREILTLNVELTDMDRPIVVWPRGMTATYGDLVRTVSISNFTGTGTPAPESLAVGVGYAYFTGVLDGVPVTNRRVQGAFEWVSGTDLVGNVGDQAHQMMFVPTGDDADLFSVIFSPIGTTSHPAIAVSKATPVVSWPESITVSYVLNALLSSVIVSDYSPSNIIPTGSVGDSIGYAIYEVGTVDVRVPGAFEWVNPTNALGAVTGSPHTHRLRFLPTDSVNFENVEQNVAVTVEKANQPAPAAPTQDSKSAINAVLIAITTGGVYGTGGVNGVQYGVNTTNTAPSTWQASVTFSNLLPNTQYYFFARFPGNENFNDSPASMEAAITTDKATLMGTISIPQDVVYGNTLTVNTSALYAYEMGDNQASRDALGAFTYEWIWTTDDSGDDLLTPISRSTSATYTLGADDIGRKIKVIVTAANAEPSAELEVGPIERRPPTTTDFIYSLTDRVYNRSPHPISVTGVTGTGVITVQYRPSNSTSELDWTATAPTNAGIYQVRVSVTIGTLYEAANVILGTYEIEKADPTLNDLNFALPGVPASPGEPNSIDWQQSFLTSPPAAVISWVHAGDTGMGVRTPMYRSVASAGAGVWTPTEAWSVTIPTVPGTYQVAVSIASGDNYNEANLLTHDDDNNFVYIMVGVDITPGDINVIGINTTYDGQTHSVSVTDSANGTIAYRLTNEAVWGSHNGQFTDATSGTVTLQYRVTRQGTGYNPYIGTVSVTIAPRDLYWNIGSVSNPATANGKTYDGTLAATVNMQNQLYAPSLSVSTAAVPNANGIVPRDAGLVTIVQGQVNFAAASNANRGTWAIDATGWDITGSRVGNYTLVNQPVFNNAEITARQLTWDVGTATNRATVNNKPYDTNTTATVSTAPSLSVGDPNGIVSRDTGTVTVYPGQVNFANANVGTWAVTATGWGITGDTYGNYIPPAQPLFSNAVITAVQLYWDVGSLGKEAVADDREYTGNRVATVDAMPSLVGVLFGDDVYPIFNAQTGLTFANANIGTWAVTATGWNIGGVDAGNYIRPATQPLFANAEIYRKQLEWNIGRLDNRATVRDKQFDNNTSATALVMPTLSGVVSGENVGVSLPSGSLNFANENAGQWGVTVSDFVITGAPAVLANYDITSLNLPFFSNARITPRVLTGVLRLVHPPDNSAAIDPNRISEGTILTADFSNIIGVPPDGVLVSDLDFQWFRRIGNVTTEIAGATAISYTVKDDLTEPINTEIWVRVTGIGNYGGTLTSAPDKVGTIPIDVKSIFIYIEGTPKLGETLEVRAVIDPPEAVQKYMIMFEWLREGESTPIASDVEKYVITEADLGKNVKVSVSGRGDYHGYEESEYLFIPAIAPYRPENLTATPGDEQVLLEWDAPFDGGSPITKYQLSIDGRPWVDIEVVESNNIISYIVTELTDEIEYNFRIRAVNAVGMSDFASIDATPTSLPRINAITPTADTVARFGSIPHAGMVGEAVFNLNCSYMTIEALEEAGTLWVSGYPAWVMPSNMNWQLIDKDRAVLRVTLTVKPSRQGLPRSGDIIIGNRVSPEVTGKLNAFQLAPPSFLMVIANSPGDTVPVGQTPTRWIFPDATVRLNAGVWEGYIFSHWSSDSDEVVFDDEESEQTSFVMPRVSIIITANWVDESSLLKPMPSPMPIPNPDDGNGDDNNGGVTPVPPGNGDGNGGGGSGAGGSGGFDAWISENLWRRLWALMLITMVLMGICWFILWFKRVVFSAISMWLFGLWRRRKKKEDGLLVVAPKKNLTA